MVIFVRTLEHRLYKISGKDKIRKDDNYILALSEHGEKVLYKNGNSDNIFKRILWEIDRQTVNQNFLFIDLEKLC